MFRRSLLMFALVAGGSVFLVDQASAQTWRFQFHSGGVHTHSDHHVRTHSPDVATLDRYSDQLSKIVEHLHDDAHHLSQDYHHSASIEHYVSELDHLKRHMHEMLHQASRHRTYSSMLDRHIKRDLAQAKQLLHRLNDELTHQSIDGARAGDQRAIKHMREIILLEAYPWIQLMEAELYGSVHHGELGARSGFSVDHTRRGDRRVIAQPRFQRHTSPLRRGVRSSF